VRLWTQGETLEAENSRLMGEATKLKDTAAAKSTLKQDAKAAAN
tara:strand:+ start:1078 stop:1209 length:132 start_codon:yes stop_codon:yes gene_type:complete